MLPTLDEFKQAQQRIAALLSETPLERNTRLSNHFKADIYLKREDLQQVRSYKIRGAYNKLLTLSQHKNVERVICASAGNHAQGVALSCSSLKINGLIIMPETTPQQKISKVESFGGKWIEIRLHGETYDEAYHYALSLAEQDGIPFVHPFNDRDVIMGQGTMGLEILEQLGKTPDVVSICVGGGGLLSGVGSVMAQAAPGAQLFGVEPAEAASMSEAMKQNKVVTLPSISKFVDGASVATIGKTNFEICRQLNLQMLTASEGAICSALIEMYNEDGIIAEPAGILAVAGLYQMNIDLTGKTVVCIVSGGNNDIYRIQEIIERAKLYEGTKFYVRVEVPQISGSFASILSIIEKEHEGLVSFSRYSNSKAINGYSSALLGVEVKDKSVGQAIMKRLEEVGISFRISKESPVLNEL